MTKLEAYETEIAPLLDQIFSRVQEHGMNFLAILDVTEPLEVEQTVATATYFTAKSTDTLPSLMRAAVLAMARENGEFHDGIKA